MNYDEYLQLQRDRQQNLITDEEYARFIRNLRTPDSATPESPTVSSVETEQQTRQKPRSKTNKNPKS